MTTTTTTLIQNNTNNNHIPTDLDSQTVVIRNNEKDKNTVLDVIIIGGGLSGLMVAHELQTHNDNHNHNHNHNDTHNNNTISFKLFEARSMLGGRIANDAQGHDIDMGGAWIWPEFQPHVRQLVKQLGLETFGQPGEDENHPDSYRLVGGAIQFIHALSKHLQVNNNDTMTMIHTNTPITDCTFLEMENLVQVQTIHGDSYKAKRVVFAIPPKVLLQHVTFTPPLSLEKQKAMKASHTWMAGVTKLSLVYSNPFWKQIPRPITNIGLPRTMGPAFQVYDASTKDGTIAALTFFTFVPPSIWNKFRTTTTTTTTTTIITSNHDETVEIMDNNSHNHSFELKEFLAKQVVTQLGTTWKAYYGLSMETISQLQNYQHVHVQHWSQERYISEDSKPFQIHSHPHPVRALSTPEWKFPFHWNTTTSNSQNDQGPFLYFAGTETDQHSPGVMEGAIGAAKRVIKEMLPNLVHF